jgi:SAM-dependent methyltransferase
MTEDRSGSQPKEVWASGEAYDPYVGRWSLLVARQFLDWLAVPPGKTWLDVGCGTGALTQAILQIAAPQAVLGIDAAQGYIAFVRGKITDQRAAFQLGDAQALPVETAAYEAVVSGLALNFVPRPGQAAAEMARAARPEGIVAAYVWDYAGGMQFMRHFWNAAAALDPAAADLDEGRRFPLCNPGPLAELFQGAGLTRVEVRPIDIWTAFKDFNDYWSPFLGGQGPAPSYVMSLSEDLRTALRERIRASLPFALDGSIPLMARAWAVRGFR